MLSKRTIVLAYSLLALLAAAACVTHALDGRRVAAEQQARARRIATPIAELRAESVGLRQAVEALSRASGVSITLDEANLNRAGVILDDPLQQLLLFDLPLGLMLDLLLENSGRQSQLAWYLTGDGIRITTADESGKRTVVAVYTTSHLPKLSYHRAPTFTMQCFGGAGTGNGLFGPQDDEQDGEIEALINLITTNIAPDTWREAGGTVGAISELPGGRLLVTQTPENQELIAKLLQPLATKRGGEWPDSDD